MKKIVKIVIIMTIAIVLILLAVKTIKTKNEATAHIPVAKTYAIVVDTMQPKRAEVTLTLPALAEVVNEQDVAITTRMAAHVLKIVPSGTKVHKGDLLVKLDTVDIEASIASVRQEMDANRIALQSLIRSHKRTKALFAVKGASAEQMEQERSKIAALRAKIRALAQKMKTLQNSLSYAMIVAPSDGVVSERFVSEGSVAVPGKALLKLSAKSGQSLIVRLPAELKVLALRYDGKEIPLVSLDTAHRGLKVYKAYIDANALAAGERIAVQLVLFHGEGMLLPFNAILDREGKSYLVEIAKGHAKAVTIQPIMHGEEGVLVKDEGIRGKRVAVAKPDLLLRLLSGVQVQSREQ